MVLSVLKWLNDTKLYCTREVKKARRLLLHMLLPQLPEAPLMASSH